MRTPHVDDRVRLIDDVPETDLIRGRVGVVCSQWSGQQEPLYEVEFLSGEGDEVARLLLRQTQIEIDLTEEVSID